MTGRAAAPPLPLAVSCDFDGTITTHDVVQAMLIRFAGPEWRVVEDEWEAGRIGARDCLERQTRMLRVSERELADWVDRTPCDPDAAAFLVDCERLGYDVRIVSDGYDWVIRRVMARLGLSHIPVVANQLRPQGDGRWTVDFPHAAAGGVCPSGVCKCIAIRPQGARVHIGDGRSDMCVSDVCDLVFAKGSLLASRERRGLGSVAFDQFAEIRSHLPNLARTVAETAERTAIPDLRRAVS